MCEINVKAKLWLGRRHFFDFYDSFANRYVVITIALFRVYRRFVNSSRDPNFSYFPFRRFSPDEISYFPGFSVPHSYSSRFRVSLQPRSAANYYTYGCRVITRARNFLSRCFGTSFPISTLHCAYPRGGFFFLLPRCWAQWSRALQRGDRGRW